MHCLVGVFVQELAREGEDPVTEIRNMWPIKIIIPPSKSRMIYFKNVQQQREWYLELKGRALTSDVTEHYTFGEILGQG